MYTGIRNLSREKFRISFLSILQIVLHSRYYCSQYFFIYLYIYLFVYLFIYLFVYLFIYLLVYLFIYLFIYLYIHLFIHLFLYLFMHLFIYLFIYCVNQHDLWNYKHYFGVLIFSKYLVLEFWLGNKRFFLSRFQWQNR